MTGAFSGESPDHLMPKRRNPNERVTCGTCRQFDGSSWCRRWNYHTAADAPSCAEYRAAPRPSGAS